MEFAAKLDNEYDQKQQGIIDQSDKRGNEGAKQFVYVSTTKTITLDAFLNIGTQLNSSVCHHLH